MASRTRPLPAKERKSSTLLVRMRDADMKALRAAAKREGVSPPEWVRTRLLARVARGD